MAGKHATLEYREWTDGYPDTLRVSLETDDGDGMLHVVVSGHAVWLNPDQADEVAACIAEYSQRVRRVYATIQRLTDRGVKFEP